MQFGWWGHSNPSCFLNQFELPALAGGGDVKTFSQTLAPALEALALALVPNEPPSGITTTIYLNISVISLSQLCSTFCLLPAFHGITETTLWFTALLSSLWIMSIFGDLTLRSGTRSKTGSLLNRILRPVPFLEVSLALFTSSESESESENDIARNLYATYFSSEISFTWFDESSALKYSPSFKAMSLTHSLSLGVSIAA